MFAELRYYFGVKNPEKLTDTKIIKLYKELEWVRQKEAESQISTMKVGGF